MCNVVKVKVVPYCTRFSLQISACFAAITESSVHTGYRRLRKRFIVAFAAMHAVFEVKVTYVFARQVGLV